MTSCGISERPSQPFLDQSLCKDSGGLVRRAEKITLRCKPQKKRSIEQSEKFPNLGTLTWRGADVWVQWSFACHFEELWSGSVRVGHTFGSMRAWQPSAGAVRGTFFLLRHLSKFPSFQNENPSYRFWLWPWEFSLLHLTREVCLQISEYAGVVWSGAVL